MESHKKTDNKSRPFYPEKKYDNKDNKKDNKKDSKKEVKEKEKENRSF